MATFEGLSIKCINCGGAMYADQKTASYQCPYCGSSVPWTEDNYYRGLPMTFRHKPVEVIDGLIKLGHVEITKPLPITFSGLLSKEYRLLGIEDKLSRWDTTTTQAFAGAFTLQFTCPSCGATISGLSTQNFFTCKACGNKIGVAESLKPGSYKKEYFMGVGAESVPHRAITFSITLEEAQSSARELVHAHPEYFGNQNMEQRIAQTMTAVYIPFSLSDLSLKVNVKSDRGDFTTYQEIVDWACPETTLYDVRLLDYLDPWDFGEVTPFDPAFAEGLFRVAAIANNCSRVDVLDYLLAERVPQDLQKAFNLSKLEIVNCARDFRQHKSSSLLLPIYYVDKQPQDGTKDKQVRLAVNGQTGKAAAVILQNQTDRSTLLGDVASSLLSGLDKEIYCTITPQNHKRMSAESTIRMIPKPVRKIKSPFLHQVLPLEKAVQKHGLAKLCFWK
jgi:DNA-directed RNA polymerase subunit RPC12/RpoP